MTDNERVKTCEVKCVDTFVMAGTDEVGTTAAVHNTFISCVDFFGRILGEIPHNDFDIKWNLEVT